MVSSNIKKRKYCSTTKQGELPLGSKGILVSYAIGMYKKNAIKEILNILTLQDSILQKEAEDMESEVDKKKEEIRRFVPIAELARGLMFIEFKNKNDSPKKIVDNIFENAENCSCRFVSKIIPIQVICSTKCHVLTEAIKNFIEDEFHYSNVLRNVDGDTDNRITWALKYNRTNSNEADKEFVLKLFDNFLSNQYKVSLNNPDKMIMFHVVKSSCAFGCVENYSKKCKMNLQLLNKNLINLR